MDEYPDFSTLAAQEVLNRDYRIRFRDAGSLISIVAPHGGRIEPGTSAAAEKMAGERFNWYCFEGMKEKNNRKLHMASHRFDEPQALDLIAASDLVVTVHACRDLEKILYIGGRLTPLMSAIGTSLKSLGIEVLCHEKFQGIHPRNICNLGRLKKGVQLEMSRGLRDDHDKLLTISRAVYKVLASYESQRQR